MAKIVEVIKPVEIVNDRCPFELMQEQLLKDQMEVMDMMKIRKLKPKPKEDDEARKISFDLFLNELDDLL